MIPVWGSGGGVIPSGVSDRQCPECRPTPPPGRPGPRAPPGLGSGPSFRLDPGERDVEAVSLRQVPAVRGPVFTSVWGIHQLTLNRRPGVTPGRCKTRRSYA